MTSFVTDVTAAPTPPVARSTTVVGVAVIAAASVTTTTTVGVSTASVVVVVWGAETGESAIAARGRPWTKRQSSAMAIDVDEAVADAMPP